jgi:hypothetical protein
MAPARRDLLLGLGVAAFALFLLLVLIPNGIAVPKGVRAAVLSTTFWPTVIARGLLLLGVLLAAESLPRARLEQGSPMRLEPDASLRVFAGAVLMLAYWWLVPKLGLVVSSMLAMLATGALARSPLPVALGATTVALPLLLWWLFCRIAGIPLPAGDRVGWP